jgi:signal transduction histidine kinase
MRWSPSILAQVATLALTTLVLAFALSLGIVLLTPTPAPVRMTVRDAAIVLGGERNGTFGLTIRSAPPARPQVVEVEASLARMLRVRPDRVRARWLDSEGAGKGKATGQSVILVGDRTLLVDSGAGGFLMRYGADVRIGPDVEMPAFEAAVRQGDGRWRTVTPIDRQLAAWRQRLFVAFGLALMLSAVPVWIAARRLSIPVCNLAESAARSDLVSGPPFQDDGPAEIRAVAAAMNAMHQRLADQAEQRFQAFAAIAHDLRTPLTGLRIRAELVPPGERERMIHDLDRMTGMIGEVLDFARIDRHRLRPQNTDLVALLTAIRDDRRSLNQDVYLADQLDDGWAMIDISLLHRALDNLIDNAVRYAGNAVLSVEDRDTQICIHVDDSGPGIPPNNISGIIAPFKRLEASRNRATGGVGLGLAITDRIAVAHGGRLILGHRRPHGLRATLSLPAHYST